jgi:hypothetical protein
VINTKKIYTNPMPFPSTAEENPRNNFQENLPENIPGSTIKCTGKASIERINVQPELLEQLKKALASNRLSPSAKQNTMRRITGFCSVCGGLPEFFMIYDCGDSKKLERYCSSCLEKEKVRIYDKLPTN